MGDLCEFGPPEADKAYRRDKNDSISIMFMLNHFFDEDRFRNPAIKDTVDSGNMLPRKDWWDIWQDRGAIGFFYQVGAEGGHGIAFSKKKNRVVLFFACC